MNHAFNENDIMMIDRNNQQRNQIKQICQTKLSTHFNRVHYNLYTYNYNQVNKETNYIFCLFHIIFFPII